MLSDPLSLDRPVSIGFPFHGIARDGVVTLPGGNGTVTFPELVPAEHPAYTGAGIMTNVRQRSTLLRNPHRTLPTRTAEQQTADADAGREYRDYGLLTGNADVVNGKRYSPDSGLSRQNSRQSGVGLYFDSQGYPWLVDLTGVLFDVDADSLSGDVVFRRALTFGSYQDDTQTVSIDLSPAGLAGIGASGNTIRSGNISGGVCEIADQKSDGSQFLLTPLQFFRVNNSTSSVLRFVQINSMRPYAVWTIDIGDTPDEGYPRSGGITFSVTPAIYKSYAGIESAMTFVDDAASSIGAYRFIENYDNGEGGNFYVANSGVGNLADTEDYLDSISDPDFNRGASNPTTPIDGDSSRGYRILDRLLAVCYHDDAIVEWSMDFDLQASQSFTSSLTAGSTGTGADETGTSEASASRSGSCTVAVRIKRNGTVSLDRTASYSHTGSGSSINDGSGESNTSGSEDVNIDYDGEFAFADTFSLTGAFEAASLRGAGFSEQGQALPGGFFSDFFDERHWNLNGFSSPGLGGLQRDPMEFVLNYFYPHSDVDSFDYTPDIGAAAEFVTFVPCMQSSNKVMMLAEWRMHLGGIGNESIVSGDVTVGNIVAADGTTQSVTGRETIACAGDIEQQTTIGHPYHFHGTPAAWQPETGQWATAAFLSLENRYEHLNYC